MNGSAKFLVPVVIAALFAGVSINSATAQVVEGHSSSSSVTTESETKGFAFKYKEKFNNYSTQIEMGISKGWLTPAQADTFKTRLNELRSVESAAAHSGYPASDIANLDKMTTKFNADLSSASTEKPAVTSKSDQPDNGATKKVITTKRTAGKKTTKSTTTKHAVIK